jgi:hypothetical protein
MGTSKSKTAGSPATREGFIRVLLRPHNRGLVLTGIVVLASIGFALYAWQRWGEPATHTAEYLVTAERISVTAQPTWIHSNVKDEVVRSLAGAKLELLDRDLVEQVAQAFALHPWVANVLRVEKRFPAQVNVELEYRQPVIVVKIDAPGEEGLLFLDEESVLLPSADFAPSQAKGYLRIMAAGETPTSVYGTPWGSERMLGAARVAAAWGDRWQTLGLYWIMGTRPSSGQLVYELRTQNDQVRVVWGVAPGHESADEASPLQKITALEQYVNDKGPLEKSGAGAVVDLRKLADGALKTAGGSKSRRR